MDSADSLLDDDVFSLAFEFREDTREKPLDFSSPGVPYSPQSLPSPHPPPAQQFLQPPPTPRMRPIPLPSVLSAPFPPTAPMIGNDFYPIDLSSDLDLEALARAIPNYVIHPRTTIHILPTSRDRSLMQFNSGNRQRSAISIICRLHALLRAPLSLQVYQSELAPDVQQAVFRYFIASSGPHGRRLWQRFLNGHHHPQGPTGAVLLQGHFNLWGFSQDYHLRWVIDVDVQRLPLLQAVHGSYSY
ncbi:hypothetical protein C8R44DRAFT_989172 [Mycena epipterygia]|nr:hypothetical protein C8R44DRAFT_989172 [Mycena epipterygia]